MDISMLTQLMIRLISSNIPFDALQYSFDPYDTHLVDIYPGMGMGVIYLRVVLQVPSPVLFSIGPCAQCFNCQLIKEK